MFCALQKSWHTILHQSSSSSDQAMTAPRPPEGVQGCNENSDKPTLKISEKPPEYIPNASNTKVNIVSQRASAREHRNDVVNPPDQSQDSEKLRTADDGEHAEREEPELRGALEVGSKPEEKDEGSVEETEEAPRAVVVNTVPAPQPSESAGAEHKLSTQVSSQNKRKHLTLGQEDRGERKGIAMPLAINDNKAKFGPQGSPFPKSIKSIQAYGDIASLAEAYHANTAQVHPTSELPAAPATTPVPKNSIGLPPKNLEDPPPSTAEETGIKKSQQKQSQVDVRDRSEKGPVSSSDNQADREITPDSKGRNASGGQAAEHNSDEKSPT